MPRGIIFIEHDEIKGPKIKNQYFKHPTEIPQEFVSKLYMSHASFDAMTTMELKMMQFKIISCFTGSKSRKSKEEGILALVLEEEEKIPNIEIFLKQFIDQVIATPEVSFLQKILTEKLYNYLQIEELFRKTEIEEIPFVMIIEGSNNEYRNTLMKLGVKIPPKDELIQIYKILYSGLDNTQYPNILLNFEEKTKTFLISKSKRKNEQITAIFTRMKPFLEAYPYYATEICAMFLIPNLIGVKITEETDHTLGWKDLPIHKILKKATSYNEEFQTLTSMLVNHELELIPLE